MSHIAKGSSEAVPSTGSGDAARAQPRWWQRHHPAFTTLAGFFAGLAFALAVPGVLAAIIGAVAEDATTAQGAPYLLLALLVPAVIAAVPRTRRFGLGMLLGTVSTAIVVLLVAALVLWLLITAGG